MRWRDASGFAPTDAPTSYSPPRRVGPGRTARHDSPTSDAIARPIRVLFCVDDFELGGSELSAVRTAELLDPAQVDVTVAALRPDGPLRPRYEQAGIRVLSWPVHGTGSIGGVRTRVAIGSALRRERFDVLHSHDLRSNMIVVPAARLSGAGAVVASRRWWREPTTRDHSRMHQLACRFAHRVLASSPSVARALETDEGLAPSRIAVVPSFVDRDTFAPPAPSRIAAWRRELELGDDATVLGAIASLRPAKDHATLFRAVATLRSRWPTLRLVLVGDGPSRRDLVALSTALGIADIVRFAGRRPQLPTLHYLFDISLLTSRAEGTPSSLIEAMAAGRPVIATNVGGIVDAITDDADGVLVPPGDPLHLAAVVDDLLRDPERRRRLGEAARRRALREFTATRVLRQLSQLYAELASLTPRSRSSGH